MIFVGFHLFLETFIVKLIKKKIVNRVEVLLEVTQKENQ